MLWSRQEFLISIFRCTRKPRRFKKENELDTRRNSRCTQTSCARYRNPSVGRTTLPLSISAIPWRTSLRFHFGANKSAFQFIIFGFYSFKRTLQPVVPSLKLFVRLSAHRRGQRSTLLALGKMRKRNAVFWRLLAPRPQSASEASLIAEFGWRLV